MAEIIDRCLNQLNECLKSSSSNRGIEAADACSDLRAYCIENVTEAQVGELTRKLRTAKVLCGRILFIQLLFEFSVSRILYVFNCFRG